MNSGSEQTLNLPSVGTGDIGVWFTIVKLGAGNVIIDAADSDVIENSGAGGTIYNNQPSETYATVILKLVLETKWIVVGYHGTWAVT